eukprot:6197657-Pleurochrysis_carterae.AAC.9
MSKHAVGVISHHCAMRALAHFSPTPQHRTTLSRCANAHVYAGRNHLHTKWRRVVSVKSTRSCWHGYACGML